MFYNIILILLISNAYTKAFTFKANKPKTNWIYSGDTKPLDYWDPLGLTSDSPEEIIKLVREGELHHGRIAMAAFPIIMFSEMNSDTLGINSLSGQNLSNQLPFWISMFIIEFYRMKVGWKNPFNKEALWRLKDDYQPGNVLDLPKDKINKDLLSKELNNGRLAMLGTLGLIGQEFVTGNNVF